MQFCGLSWCLCTLSITLRLYQFMHNHLLLALKRLVWKDHIIDIFSLICLNGRVNSTVSLNLHVCIIRIWRLRLLLVLYILASSHLNTFFLILYWFILLSLIISFVVNLMIFIEYILILISLECLLKVFVVHQLIIMILISLWFIWTIAQRLQWI